MTKLPPLGPTSLTQVIPAYLYQEYSDDPDLQSFWSAYNTLAQQYLNWFVQFGQILADYRNPLIIGPLLDWIAQGLYGMARPTLFSSKNKNIGSFNTWAFNTIPYDRLKRIGPQTYYATTDDVFKRVLTWHVFKGDGKVFDIRWLKRRVARFLQCANGTSLNVDQTYQISVTFGVGNQVTIRLISGIRTVLGGALYNRFKFNTMRFNGINTSFMPLAPITFAATFQEAVQSGALELPFQFTYNIVIV
jgi:hypothetical protein